MEPSLRTVQRRWEAISLRMLGPFHWNTGRENSRGELELLVSLYNTLDGCFR